MLEKPTTVTWFTPSRMAAGAAPVAPTHEQHIGHATGDFSLTPEAMLSPVLTPHMMPVTDPSSYYHHSATKITLCYPWSVYGPAFNRLKDSFRRSQYPSDDSCSSLGDSDSITDDDDLLAATAATPESWSNLTFSEMPMELLGTILQQFMYIPRESLDHLAHQRAQARMNAPIQDFSSLPPQAAAYRGSFWNKSYRAPASDTSSSSSHSRRTSLNLDTAYDGEDDGESTEVDSDSGDESRGKTWDPAVVLANKITNLALDNAEQWAAGVTDDDETGSTSSGSHNTRYGRSSSATDSDDDARSASRSPTIIPSAGSPKAAFFHHNGGLDLVQCQQMCSGTYMPSSVPRHGINRVDNTLPEADMLDELHRDQFFHPTTHTSLNSDLYKASLVNRQWRVAALQLLWQSVVLDAESCRPEPTDPCIRCSQLQTPKSSRRSTSSMSTASDSETSASSPASSSASSPRTLAPTHVYTPVRRTRLEAMLDSYLELYGLDLAKCVQTVELDLRLLAWPAEGESVKRILRRLSPFTHLRLVWAEDESPEELIAGFRVAMEFLHPQVRHLHFLSGFVISKAWTQEMDKMTRLDTITLDQLGSMDVIQYDWRKIKCLRMNAVIPRGIFQYPTWMTMPTQAVDYPVTQYITNGSLTIVTTPAAAAPAQEEEVDQGFEMPGMTLPSSGWWQWTGLRKIEIRLQNAVLPAEWLQDLTNVLAENALTMFQQYGHANSDPLMVLDETSSPVLLGPPLEVLNIDCQVSHPHKDVFALLVHSWGHRLEEFHFTKSDELTDEFFLLCMQKMTRVKKLSLRESKGITGEGFANVPILLRPDFLELNLDQSRVRGDFLEALRDQCPTVQYQVREVRD
ncbi:hypothetical protein B0O80DRAFT_497485 [Mortierella sp. GBAus27b]|nr:hypothetical protein B0O80DRAFT_497485 [Mortierella sp. GBAus27b]